MFYEPGISSHGLPHDPFKSCVVPRPIGWISTRDRAGRDNLAPFSWNMAVWALRHAVNESAEALPPAIDEFERTGLTKEPALRVNAPMVAESPVRFECEYMQTVRLPGGG